MVMLVDPKPCDWVISPNVGASEEFCADADATIPSESAVVATPASRCLVKEVEVGKAIVAGSPCSCCRNVRDMTPVLRALVDVTLGSSALSMFANLVAGPKATRLGQRLIRSHCPCTRSLFQPSDRYHFLHEVA